jgi:hypothetical protein
MKMGSLGILLGAVALLAAGGGAWQHWRYLRARRGPVQDSQPLYHSRASFHIAICLKLASGDDVVGRVRALRDHIEASSSGRLVYAGQVGLTMIPSEQLSNDWDALLLLQFASRADFDALAASDDYRRLLARAVATHTHGFERSWLLNLMLPQALFLVRLGDLLRRKPASYPFTPVGADATPKLEAKMKEAEALNGLRHLGEDAVVIFNLLLPGNSQQRAADRSYTRRMVSGMAERGYGPMHMGKAVSVEGDARFERVAVVYYPGIDYFQEMLGSTFMNGIAGDKQLGDSLAVATIPIASKLATSRP